MKLPVIDGPHAQLPRLYARWMGDVLPGPIPAETEATCDDCAMCAGGADRPTADFLFDPSTKCCTYIPELPNYIVGLILNDDDANFAAGRATMIDRLETGVAITPISIGKSPTEMFLYQQTSQLEAFGRNPNLRCPHYLEDANGACGLWKHRAAVCATWHCKHVRGMVGFRFWKEIFQLLVQVELELAHWCVMELDVGTAALQNLFSLPVSDDGPTGPTPAGLLDGKRTDEASAEIWGEWAGRQKEFYAACGQLVETLAWEDVTKLCGSATRIHERLTRDAYKNLVLDEIPESLRVGPIKLVQMGADFHRVKSYSPLDPLDLPRKLVELLHYFDGRPTKDAIKSIAADTGHKLDDDLVRKLVDFQILVP